MATNPTTGELYQAKALTGEDLAAAVDAFMTDPTTTLFLFSNGYQLDIAAAIRSHPFSNATISGGNATRTRKRAAIRTAILLARPEKA